MKTPARMDDLTKVDTPLSDAEKQECRLAGLRQKEIAALGDRYMCHPSNAPAKGFYNNQGIRLQ